MVNEELMDLLDRFASEIDDHIDSDPPVVVVVGEADPGPRETHIGVEGADRLRDIVGVLEMGQAAAREHHDFEEDTEHQARARR